GLSTGDYRFLPGVFRVALGDVRRSARLQDALFWSGDPRAVPGPVCPVHHVSAAALSDPAAHHRRGLLLQLRPDRRRAGGRVFRLLRPGRRSTPGDVLRRVPVPPRRGRCLDAAGTAGRTTGRRSPTGVSFERRVEILPSSTALPDSGDTHDGTRK